MAVEAIQKVTQVEAEADRRKEEAMAESKPKAAGGATSCPAAIGG